MSTSSHTENQATDRDESERIIAVFTTTNGSFLFVTDQKQYEALKASEMVAKPRAAGGRA
jgi:hypothetical protein